MGTCPEMVTGQTNMEISDHGLCANQHKEDQVSKYYFVDSWELYEILIKRQHSQSNTKHRNC